jgi:hypothetical protein
MNADMAILASLEEVNSSVMDSDELMAQGEQGIEYPSISDGGESINDYDTYYDSETGERHPGRHNNKQRVLLDQDINNLDSDDEEVRVAKGLNDEDKELIKTIYARRSSNASAMQLSLNSWFAKAAKEKLLEQIREDEDTDDFVSGSER